MFLRWIALAIMITGMQVVLGAVGETTGVVGIGGIAHADKDEAREAAKQHSRAGSIHYNLSHYEQAIEEYTQAYRLYPLPELLFNLGQCHRGLGDHASAITLYRNYLRQKPNAPNRWIVKQLIAESQEALDQSRRHPSLDPAMLSSGWSGTTAVGSAGDKAPLYKRWWFWTIVGSAALTAGGTAYYLGQQDPPIPTGTLGWLDRR